MLALRGLSVFFLVVMMTALCWLVTVVPAIAEDEAQTSQQILDDYQGDSAPQVRADPEPAYGVHQDATIQPVHEVQPSHFGQMDEGGHLTQAPAVDESAKLPIKYWGNSFSLKFHRPSCPFAKAMSAHHVMFFNFRRQAVESGQVPCRYCLPPDWTTVRATIWHPAQPVPEAQPP